MRFFFITGLGRSGSAFLAHLLNLDPKALVQHEPFREDYLHLPLGYYGGAQQSVAGYVRERRQLVERKLDAGVAIYGEVNSLLRYFTDELREAFDDPVQLFVVRNGRSYVKSAFVRTVYTEESLHAHILPKDDDPWVSCWRDFDRFARLCWYWNHTNGYLASKLARFVRFEDLLRDYEVLRTAVLEPTGVTISRDVYQQEAARPRNTSTDFMRSRFGRGWRSFWRPVAVPAEHLLGEWTASREKTFQAICGDTMRRLGYS